MALVACSIAGWLPLRTARAEDEAPLLAQAPGLTPAPAKSPAPAPAAQPRAAPKASPNAAPENAAEPPAAEPPPEPEPEPDFEAPAPTLTSQEATNASKQRLQNRLQELDAERASTTNLLPWITVGTGAAVVLVSASVGAFSAFDCEPGTKCTAPPWASLAVVIGAAIATAGAIWLVRTDADIRELELKRDLLKLDLERLELSRVKREGLARRGDAQLSFQLSF